MLFFVSYRARSQTGAHLFALFLSGLVLDDFWYFSFFGERTGSLVLSLVSALTATLFVSTFQHFPHKISRHQIFTYIRFAPLAKVMSFLVRGNNIWTFFMPIVFILIITSNLLSISGMMMMVNLLIILFGFTYMYLN